MLALKNINKEYNGNNVLKDININFREKEFVVILGPSGCGKTTLLNLIATIEKPDGGSISFGQTDITLLKEKELNSFRSNYISYIFQNYNLINHISVLSNIDLPAEIKNRKNNRGYIKRVLEDLNLSNFEKKQPSKISGGEKQRIAIARSIINNSPIILADEPTGALDTSNSENVMKTLKELSKDKLVILVTHNELLAKKYGTRIIRLKDGKIEKDSHPYNEITNQTFNYQQTKLKYLTAFKLSFNNLKNKKARSYLTTIAFSLGLISLGLVLSISSGFKKEISKLEKESLFNYPIIISKEFLSIENSFKSDNNVYNNEIINIKKTNILYNKIDNNLLKQINSLDKNLVEGVAYYKNIPLTFQKVSLVNPNNEYFNLLNGSLPQNKKEVLLLLDKNGAISEELANYLKIKTNKIEDVLNKKIKINSNTIKIVGVVNAKDNYFKDLSGILYNDSLFNSEINDIHIYASSYENKLKIKEYFKDYNLLDEAKSVVDLTGTLVNGITIILIAFSILSLIVSLIMISIITYISVLERKKEIGILRTLGASKQDIKKIFLSESMLIGILSSIMSISFVYNISKLINEYISTKINMQNILSFNYYIVLIILLTSIFLTYISGLIPSIIASRKRIADALLNE